MQLKKAAQPAIAAVGRMLTNERTSQPTDQQDILRSVISLVNVFVGWSVVGWLVQESRTYLLYSRVIANFLLKFLNSRYHGNGGSSETNFTTTVKLFHPEKPLLREGMGVVSPIQAELLSIFCRRFECHQDASFEPLTTLIGP